MSKSLSELRAMSDDEMEREYDAQARFTSVGIAYWRDELDRRSRERATASNNKLALASFRLSVLSSVASVLALAVAVVALFVTA